MLPCFIFALFAFWSEGQFKTLAIELYVKDYVKNWRSGKFKTGRISLGSIKGDTKTGQKLFYKQYVFHSVRFPRKHYMNIMIHVHRFQTLYLLCQVSRSIALSPCGTLATRTPIIYRPLVGRTARYRWYPTPKVTWTPHLKCARLSTLTTQTTATGRWWTATSPIASFASVLKVGKISTMLYAPSPEYYTTYWMMTIYSDAPIDKALHQFLTLLLILTLLPNLTFYLIARGFHRTFASVAACQQRILTPQDTWSCPTLGLESGLMWRPMSPELVLFPDFWVSNIPRYFCFCYHS